MLSLVQHDMIGVEPLNFLTYTQRMADSETTKPAALPGPIYLAKEALSIYQKRFWTIVGVSFLSIIYIVGVVGIAGVIGFLFASTFSSRWNIFSILLGGLLVVVALVVFIWLSNWIQAAYILVIRDWKKGTGARESFRQARQFIWPLFTTTFLLGLIVMGSLPLFILPAILFGIWFTYAQYVVVCEGKRGLLALHTSREFFRGRFWQVIWRSIAVRLPEIILGLILTSLIANKTLPPLVNSLYQLLSLLLAPFYLAYTFALYSSLRKHTPAVSTVPQENKRWYIGVPIVGYLLVFVSAFFIVNAVRQVVPEVVKQLQDYTEKSANTDRINPGTQIVYGLISYNTRHGEYPTTLSELIDDGVLTVIPNDPRTGLPYRYERTQAGKDFSLCTPMNVRPEKCLTSASKTFEL